MISIIIERSWPQMVVLGMYDNENNDTVWSYANKLNEINVECDVDVLEFCTRDELNRFLTTEAGFIPLS